jgi:hypothetical protein
MVREDGEYRNTRSQLKQAFFLVIHFKYFKENKVKSESTVYKFV